ncbi:amidohydrolase family protein [Maricaulis maris]|uniref:amidohydrolase family protein n=1 Tax=Maricaulis maris TaxID=74318 RepID=UPI002924A3D9|nr:amidohydrolase [Maricaulis maris]
MHSLYSPVLAALVSLAPVVQAQPDLIIRDVVIVSPESPHDGERADIAIIDGRISEIGPNLSGHGRQELDGDGGYLVPGLIDAHVHLYHATGLRAGLAADYESLRAGFMSQQPRSFLYYGYTSVVELNAIASANARFEASPVHPRLFHCGQGVVLPDGFMSLEFGPDEFAASFPNYLHDPEGSNYLPDGADPAAHTPDAVLDAIEADGGRCVKLYYEEALWWPGGPPPFALPSVDALTAVHEAAAARSMPVFLHATTPDGFTAGLEAGLDAFAHGLWEWPEEGFAATGPSEATQALSDRLAGSGAYLQPTFRTLRNTQSLFHPESLLDPAWETVVGADYLAYLTTDAQRQRDQFLGRFRSLLPDGTTDADMPALQDNFNARYRALIGDYYRQGGKLSFGTDTAVGGFGWASPPGLAGYWEMLDWSEAGIAPHDILAAATVVNARLLGLQDELGRIDRGLRADLILLRSDPRVDISAMSDIRTVILDGSALDRDSLSARARP